MLRFCCSLVVCFTLTSCAWVGQLGADSRARLYGSTRLQADASLTLSNAEACSALRDNAHAPGVDLLDGEQIRLLNWNTQKHGHTQLHHDLAELSSQADLVLLQEHVMDGEHADDLSSQLYWNFAPGYIKAGHATGVMTGSRVAPVGYCKLASVEPWLGSPKATSITRYALKDREDSLLVINMHMINFTLTTDAMRTQLKAALDYARAHQGPIIVSGDLNTWSTDRITAADSALRGLGLTPVVFADDQRTRIFGLPVDHIYVRGLEWSGAQTHAVASSDHNALSATLRVY